MNDYIVEILYWLIIVLVDGDVMNDWLTHVPAWMADVLVTLGNLLVG